jgi:phospholipase/carboxylesterase
LLKTVVFESSPHPALTVVMLHGYAMGPQDLLPFAHSLGVAARFVVPTGPVALLTGSHAWWDVNLRKRTREIAAGGRDVAKECPAGLAAARGALAELLNDLDQRHGGLGRLALLGFSQGGMLACDFALFEARRVDALALLSSSRLAFDEWQPRLPRVRGVPVLVAHGRSDTDLSFAAGEALRDCLVGAGAAVEWVPFDGGHETPLLVWRQLRKFFNGIVSSASDKALGSP